MKNLRTILLSPRVFSFEMVSPTALLMPAIMPLDEVLFCFFIVLPYMLKFFAHSVPDGVRLMPDITYAVDFITHMLLIFGLCFQVPLLCLLMVYLKVIEVTTLKTIRPYIIVAAFTIGMLITPPDVFSQIIVAVPLCILYELGIFLTYFIKPRKSLII